MSRRRQRLGIIAGLAACVAVGVLWVFFAPVGLGGSLDYAVVHGSSMEPRVRSGDLAVVQKSSHYNVGDVVAYQNLQLGRVVLHRIVGRIGDRYVFKGDNNGFLDSYTPTRSKLIGRLWVRVPVVGSAFSWLHEPNHAAVFAGLIALLLLGGGGVEAGRRRERRAGRIMDQAAGTRKATRSLSHDAARGLLGLGVLAGVVFGVIALLGYGHGATRKVEWPGAFTHQGVYGYAATTQPGTVYPSGRIGTGQTVFTRLVHRVRIDFRYRFRSDVPHAVDGTARLDAVLTSSVGWSRPIAAGPISRFSGDQTKLSLPLNLDTLEAQIAGYLHDTGLASDSFNVVVTPRVKLHGRVGGEAVADAFAPAGLSLLLDRYSLRLAQPTLGSAAPGQPAPDPLHPSAVGTLHRTVPSAITVLGAQLRVTTFRSVGLLGFVASLVAAMVGAVLFRTTRGGDELTRILRRHADEIVPVASPPAPPLNGFVDVAGFESLVQIAAGYDRVILHDEHAGEHSFYVDDDNSVYRYRPRPGAERQAALRPPADAALRG